MRAVRAKREKFDPTKNVAKLNKASNKRQDNLRESLETIVRIQNDHVKEVLGLQVAHIKELSSLRADYTRQLTDAEAKRIDAIRAVDVGAVSVAAQKAQDQAAVLATQLATTADSLRTLIGTAATTNTESNQRGFNDLTGRIAALEQSRSAGTGASDNTTKLLYVALTVTGLVLAFLTYQARSTTTAVAPTAATPAQVNR